MQVRPNGLFQEVEAHAFDAEHEADRAQSMDCLQQLIYRNPLSGPAWLQFGCAALKAGQICDGVTGIRVAAQYHGGDSSFAKRVMLEAASIGLWPEAAAMADEVLRTSRQDSMALLCRAEAQLHLNRLTGANQTLTQVLALEPTCQKALILRARIERLTNKVDVGHIALRKALESAPTNGTLRAELVLTSLRQEKFDDAQRLMDAHPVPSESDTALLVARGRLAEHRKDFVGALSLYNRALAIEEGEADALTQAANLCLRRVADPYQAFRLTCKLVDVTPVATASVLLYADACEAVGRSVQVIERLKEFLKAFPEDSRVALRLTRLLLRVGDAGSGRTAISKFVSNRSTAFKLTHALTQAAAGNWRHALDELHAAYVPTNVEELVRALRQLEAVLPNAALVKAFANLVVVKWAVPTLGFRMFEETLARGQLGQCFEWARAILLWKPELYSASEVAKIVSAARLNGHAGLADSWSAWLPAESASHLSATAADSLTGKGENGQVVDSLSSLIKGLGDTRSWERLFIGLVLSLRFEEAIILLNDAKRRWVSSAERSRLQFELSVIRGDVSSASDIARGFTAANFRPNLEMDLLLRMLGEYLRLNDVDAADRLLVTLAAVLTTCIDCGLAEEPISHYLRFLVRHGEGQRFENVAKVALGGNFERIQILDSHAEYCQSEGLLDESLASTRRAIELYGDQLNRRQREAALLARMKRWPEALRSAVHLLQTSGYQQGILQLYAETLVALNNLRGAESVLRLSINLWPTALPVIRRFAAHLSANGHLLPEIDNMRRRCEAYSQDLTTRLHLAVCLEQQGEWGAADSTFTSLLGTRMYDISVLEAHVRLRYLRMHNSGAQELIARFDLVQPMVPQSALRLAALYRMISNGAAAGRLLRRAATTCSGHPAIRLALLEHVVADESPAEASDLLEQTLAAEPLNPRVFYIKGMNHYHAGDKESAKAAFASAVFLNRNFQPALIQLALIQEEALHFHSALAIYERIMEIAKRTNQNPGGRAHWHLVTVLMITGQYQKAIIAHTSMCESLNSAFSGGARIWRGESLKDQQLVVAMRGGPGDELRIASLCFRDRVIAHAKRCTFACDPRLYTLLSRSYPEIEFIPTYSGHRQLRRGTARIEPTLDRVAPSTGTRFMEMAVPFDQISGADYVCHSDALFHQIFFEGVLAEGRVLKPHFIVPSSGRRREMRDFLDSLGTGPKIGLSWRGSYVSRYRDRVFLGIDEIDEILKVEGVNFVNLQPNTTPGEVAVLNAASVRSVPGLDLYDDFEGLAALLSELDLVLTPGVTLRDVSAAVNTPTWSFTMSPGAGDVWRRQDDGRDRWQSAIVHYDLITYGSRQKIVSVVAEDLARFRDTSPTSPRE